MLDFISSFIYRVNLYDVNWLIFSLLTSYLVISDRD